MTALRCSVTRRARSTFALERPETTTERRRVLPRCSPLGGAIAAGGSDDMPRVENERIVESTTEARAGVTGHNVRYILVISTLAVIALFAVVYALTRG